MKSVIIIFFILYCNLLVKAQNDVDIVSVQGFIVDKMTNEPIPFANFHFRQTYIGTSSDNEGGFKILVPSSMQKKIISISAVGYESMAISLKDIIQLKDSIVIKMSPAITLLPEIPIYDKEMNGHEVLLRAFSNKINQPTGNHIYRIRYEGVGQEENGLTVYDVNALLEAAYEFRDGGWWWSLQIKEKRNNLSPDFEKIVENVHFLNGNWNFRESINFHHCDLKSKNCLNQLKFNDNNFTLYDNRICFVIQYEVLNPTPEQTRTKKQNIDSLRGSLYIDMINFRILRWEIDAIYGETQIKKYKKSSMMNTYPVRYHYVRNYRIIDDVSYPSLIQVLRTDKIIYRGKQIKTITTSHNSYITDVILNKIRDHSVGNFRFDLNLTEYNKTFWENNTDNY